MKYGVPDLHQREDDYADINHLSGFSANKNPAATTSNEGEIRELLWQDGQIVVQKPLTKIVSTPPFVGGSGGGDATMPAAELPAAKERPEHFFMQEDEMGSWLHYPVEDSSLSYGDLFCSAAPPIVPATTAAEIRPLPPQSPPRIQNFGNFSRDIPSYKSRTRIDSMSKPPPPTIAGDYAEGESNETCIVARESRVSRTAPTNRVRELTATSSPGGSGTSFSGSADTRSVTPKEESPPPPPPAVERKRKDTEVDDNGCRSEDVEFEGTAGKRQGSTTTSTSTKRSRAAEVHNQSERRRRDRINEKMRALQELIPRYNKSDKASMLDEAIEYLKSLQMQVQMMTMGCGTVPMMYPGMQQYMPAMGMGMGMGMTRPMVPYPSMLPVPVSAMPSTSAASHMVPRFPTQGFHLPHDHSRTQPSNQHDPALNSLLLHNANQPSVQNFVEPYHQLLGLRQSQPPLPQSQAMVQHDAKASTSKEAGNTESKQPGRK